MKKKIAMYWPLALIAPLAVAAWAHAWNNAAEAGQMPLAADQLTAELARAVSYGLVGVDDHAPALKAMPAGAGEPSPQST